MHRLIHRAKGAPLAKPFLQALDRLPERGIPQPAEVLGRAAALWAQHFGEGAPETAFAQGHAGLINDHTHYFNGFGLLAPLPFGVAVALRPGGAPASRLATAFGAGPLGEEAPGAGRLHALTHRVLQQVVRRFAPDGSFVDAAVASTLPPACIEPYCAALAVAAARAADARFRLRHERPVFLRAVRDALAEALGGPFSMTYVLAAYHEPVRDFCLTDAETLELLTLPFPEATQLGWGLVCLDEQPESDQRYYTDRLDRTLGVVAELKQNGFAALESLRDLAHADYERALGTLRPGSRGTLRYLVAENRRVQKVVAAIRKADWQMLGALLLMSHASKAADWQGTSAHEDFLAAYAESHSIDGIYGAAQTGRGGCVLSAGQPYTMPGFLDGAAAAFTERFGLPAHSYLL